MRLNSNGTDCGRIIFQNNTLGCLPQNEGLSYELFYTLGFLIAPLVTCIVVFAFLLGILVISKTLHTVWILLLRFKKQKKPSFVVKKVRKLSIVKNDLDNIAPSKPPRYSNNLQV